LVEIIGWFLITWFTAGDFARRFCFGGLGFVVRIAIFML